MKSTNEIANEILDELEQEEKKIVFTPYLATAYAEGFGEGEDATEDEKLQAWGYLIKTGLCWSLQGWYGRTANNLIENGYISKEGEILISLEF